MGLLIIWTGRWSLGQISMLETLERSTQPTCTHRLAKVLARWLATLLWGAATIFLDAFCFLLECLFPIDEYRRKKKNLSLNLGWVPKRANNPATYPCKLLSFWSDAGDILSSLGSLFLAGGQKYQKCWPVALFLFFFSNYRATVVKRAT